jgi:hypothetical protein
MTKRKKKQSSDGERANRHGSPRPSRLPFALAAIVLAAAGWYFLRPSPSPPHAPSRPPVSSEPAVEIAGWTGRAEAVSRQFHRAYTPCWEGAYGAIGDAYLFAATGDSSLLRFHLMENDLRNMCEGTWVDDRAWVCLAELRWWEVTGKIHAELIEDARHRYDEARAEGRLSSHEGFWTWYNWIPGSAKNERIFTNSNMNQMATAACGLYMATGIKKYLGDALLVWEGDGRTPGIEKQWYRGNGVWEGRNGKAAFGKELPWNGLGCVPLAAALFTATQQKKYREIAISTVKRMLDPKTGWVDPTDFYQLRMDGNGVFVNAIFDGYAIAPRELAEVPAKIERMLDHVWSNHQGRATVTLHRLTDHGIRNGWNPNGGEDGYGVGEVGTVHAQGEAARAFGVFAYFRKNLSKEVLPTTQGPH